MWMNPAACVFEAFGGVAETARVLCLSKSAVSRWVITEEQVGQRRQRDGIVPMRHFGRLIEEAEARGKHLTLHHLVFGRNQVEEGVVIVRDGRKVEVRMPDVDMWQRMTKTLSVTAT